MMTIDKYTTQCLSGQKFAQLLKETGYTVNSGVVVYCKWEDKQKKFNEHSSIWIIPVYPPYKDREGEVNHDH